jgi:hypothetical protein
MGNLMWSPEIWSVPGFLNGTTIGREKLWDFHTGEGTLGYRGRSSLAPMAPSLARE